MGKGRSKDAQQQQLGPKILSCDRSRDRMPVGLPIRTPGRKTRYCQNSMPEAGEMAEWVKGLLHKHEGLSLNRQSPCEVRGGSV